MAISFQKVSGVAIITQTAGAGKYYDPTALANAKFSPNGAGTGVNVTIGGDNYEISLADLTVNGDTPSTLSSALVLLNSFFGT